MPEGPEIHRAARQLHRAVAGKRVREVVFNAEALGQPDLVAVGKELAGLRVESVGARGKAILTRFESGSVIYSHNQLYGVWMVSQDGSVPETRRSLRLALHTEDGPSALLYSASDIEVLDEESVEAHPYIAALGPDALDPQVTEQDLLRRMESKTVQGRQLANLLLDQGFVAGMGNYLRSEVLFRALLHPRARPRDLGQGARETLAESLLTLPRRSLETAGITNEPAWVERLKAEGAKRPVYRFAVFNRDGAPCLRCETSIQREEVGGRRLYLCPTCQRDPR
ncbi:MAG: endonuclease VIII [Acidobacteriota bacterium]